MIPNFPLRVLSQKIAFSTLIQYAGKVVQIFISAAALKLVSNFLSENDYGIYAGITEYALFFSVAANLGIYANIVRKMADNPIDGKLFVNALILRVVTALGFFVLGFIYLLLIGSEGAFLAGTALFFSVLLLDFITSVCDGMLQANYKMGRATLALILGRLIALGGIFWLVRVVAMPTLFGISGMVLIFGLSVLGSLLTALLSFYFVSQKINLHWQIDRAFLWTVFKTGLPFGIISFINSLYFRFLPDYFSHAFLSHAQFAAFNISFRIAQVMSLFSTFLMFSVLPGLREYIDQKHWQKVRKLYSRIVWILLASGFLLVVFGFLLGPTVIALLTHQKYLLPDLWYILPLMLLLAAISYGYDLVLITLFAFDQDRWLLRREMIALLVALLFFGGSLLVMDLQAKLLLILFGAIAGESTMTILGWRKTRKILEELHGNGPMDEELLAVAKSAEKNYKAGRTKVLKNLGDLMR